MTFTSHRLLTGGGGGAAPLKHLKHRLEPASLREQINFFPLYRIGTIIGSR